MTAVVTVVSSHLWDEYRLFWQSVRRYNDIQIVVVGVELPANIRRYILGQPGTTLIEMDAEPCSQLRTIDNDWKKWYKPLFIKQALSGLTKVLWLDVDTIITGPLGPIIERIDYGFIVMQDYFAPAYCHNNDGLYEHLNMAVPTDRRVLNSGVIGFSLPRDQHIIDRWQANVESIHKNQELYDLVSLHDQGSLLLTLQQLDSMDSIVNDRQWNFPARRLIYPAAADLVTAAIDDHPDALIVHYAGSPKLSKLGSHNNQTVKQYFRQRYGNLEPRNYLVTGFEQFHEQITRTFRTNARYGGWLHGISPSIAAAATAKQMGKKTDFPASYICRKDCPLSMTVDPWLAPFVENLDKTESEIYAVTILGDPIAEFNYRLRNFAIPKEAIDRAPGCYRHDYQQWLNPDRAFYQHHRRGGGNSIVECCLSNFKWYLEKSIAAAQRGHRGVIINAGTATEAIDRLEKLTSIKLVRPLVTTPTQDPLLSPETEQWVKDIMIEHGAQITEEYYKILYKWKVSHPTMFPLV